MTASRPDLLPFALPKRIGLPWHGLVRDGKLQLPDATEKTWVSGSADWSSATMAVQHPLAANQTNLAGEDQNHIWQNYAILSHESRVIGAVALGSNYWLYCDQQKTWLVHSTLTGKTNGATLKIFLDGEFGKLGNPGEWLESPRELASLSFTSKDYAGAAVSPMNISARSSHSFTGATTAFNIFSRGTAAAAAWPFHGITTYRAGEYDGNDYLHDIIVGTITGNGGEDGVGISATLTHYRNAQQLGIEVGFPTYIVVDHVCTVTGAGTLELSRYSYQYVVASSVSGSEEFEGLTWNIMSITHAMSMTWDMCGVQLAINGAWSATYSERTALYSDMSGNINGVPMTDFGLEPESISTGQGRFYMSGSIDLAVIRMFAYGNGASVDFTTAIGKQGHNQAMASGWDPLEKDVTYDPIAGKITVGETGERLFYV